VSSIRRQLTLGVMGTVVVLYGLAALLCYLITTRTVRRDFDSALAERARALSALVVQERDGRLEVMPAESTMAEFGKVPDAQYLEIWDPAGNVVQRSASLGAGDVTRPRSSRTVELWNAPLPNGRPGRGVRILFTPGVEVEPDAAPDAEADDPAAPAPRRDRFVLVLLRDLTPVKGVERVLLSSLLATFALLCGGTLALVPVMVRRGLAPLRRLSSHAERVDVRTLSGHFPVDGLPAELRPITERLNDLLTRLEEGFRRERRFSADVAHELRTPIAELRTLAEVALRWPGDEQAARAGFTDVLAVARQMEEVVTTLLALARFDAGRLTGRRERVDLGAAVRDAWRPLANTAAARELAVTFDVDEDGIVTGDPAMAASIVTNLLTNAATYTPPGGLVDCVVRRCESFVELAVSNTNASLSSDDLRDMLQPFWRKDTSRTDASHSGLGLALVSAYAQVLGAQFVVRLTPQNLFVATLRFPRGPGGALAARPLASSAAL
jgi:signal transduction histidine kinase